MFKFKQNVGFRELEKFGYIYLQTCYYKDIDGEWVVRIDKEKREIKCWNFVNGKTKNVKPYINDLIKANLVEEVGE